MTRCYGLFYIFREFLLTLIVAIELDAKDFQRNCAYSYLVLSCCTQAGMQLEAVNSNQSFTKHEAPGRYPFSAKI